MKRGPDTWFRELAHRYRELENAGHADVLLTVVFTGGGVALAGMVALAFVQTYAVLILELVLALVTTASVLVTILAMLGDDEQSPPTRTTDPR
jgi:esterase/lipase